MKGKILGVRGLGKVGQTSLARSPEFPVFLLLLSICKEDAVFEAAKLHYLQRRTDCGLARIR